MRTVVEVKDDAGLDIVVATAFDLYAVIVRACRGFRPLQEKGRKVQYETQKARLSDLSQALHWIS